MRQDQLIFSGVLILLLVTACSDPETKASETVAKVVRLVAEAEQEVDASDQLRMLERANTLVLEVRESYPDTAAGRAVNAGRIDSSLSVADVESRLHQTRRYSEINAQAERCIGSDDPLCLYGILTEYVQLLAARGLRRTVSYQGAEERHRQWLMIQSGDFEQAARIPTQHADIRSMIMEAYVREVAGRESIEQVVDKIQQLAEDLTGQRGPDRTAERKGFETLLSIQPEAVNNPTVKERLTPSRNTYLTLGPPIWRAEFHLGGARAAIDYLEDFMEANFRERDRARQMAPALVELLAIAYSIGDEPGADQVLERLSDLLDTLADTAPSLVEAPREIILGHFWAAAAISAGQPEMALEAAESGLEEILTFWLAAREVPHYMAFLLPRRSQMLFISEAANEFLVEQSVNDPDRALSLIESIASAESKAFSTVDEPLNRHWMGVYPQGRAQVADAILEGDTSEQRCRMAALLVQSAIAGVEKIQSNFSASRASSRVAVCFAAVGDAAAFQRWGHSLSEPDRARGLMMLGQFEDAEALIVSSRSMGAGHRMLLELAEHVATSRGLAEARQVLERNHLEPGAVRGFLADHAARNGDVGAVLAEVSLMSFADDWERSRKSESLVSLAAQNGHLLAAFQLSQRLFFDEPRVQHQAIDSIASAHWETAGAAW